jgi:hypothetical protein
VRSDPCGAFDDSKLSEFGCFSPIDKASDWIADRLAEGPTGIVALGGRQFRLGVVTALTLGNHFLTFLYVDVSMRRHHLK